MHAALFLCLAALGANAEPLKAGGHERTLQSDGRERSYLVHLPASCDGRKPMPVVLALHGAWTNGRIMQLYSGLNRTADEKGFIVVYPNGTGPNDTTLFWNSGKTDRRLLRTPPDDSAFLSRVIDDLSAVTKVDAKRVYATGISNGGMMCYKLAADLSDRIAAIAPISGTECFDDCKLKRPVSVLHFHGHDDKIVPYDARPNMAGQLLGCKSVDETIKTWIKLDGCPVKATTESLPHKADDSTAVRRSTYGPGKDGSEVVLIEIEGGGHTWPGASSIAPVEKMLGKTTHDISANELIWQFFERHPMK